MTAIDMAATYIDLQNDWQSWLGALIGGVLAFATALR